MYLNIGSKGPDSLLIVFDKQNLHTANLKLNALKSFRNILSFIQVFVLFIHKVFM